MLSQSNIKISLSNQFALSRATDLTKVSIQIIVPSDLQPINNSCTLSQNTASCTLSSTQLYTIRNIGDFSSSIQLTFKCNTNFFVSTNNFDIKLYYDTYLISSDVILKVLSYCSVPCKQCSTIKTECMSCLPTPYTQNTTYYADGITCVSICPATYYLITANNSCSKCNQSACLNCFSNQNNCTSCANNKYLYLSTCLSTCPDTFYASTLPN